MKKRPHKSFLGKHTQINPNQNFFLISNYDLFWSQEVPWVMFMTKTNLVFKTNWINICIWAKTLVPYWKSKSRKIQISDLLHLRWIRFWLSNFSASFWLLEFLFNTSLRILKVSYWLKPTLNWFFIQRGNLGFGWSMFHVHFLP